MRITEDLLRRRSEHNDGVLSTLQEISLHQQHLERIELINQLCRRLKILYLQNNVICKIEKLNRLKELEHLNLAVNNVAKVQNLQRCESLRRLDLTLNFVDAAGLLSVASLRENEHLQELCLVGNPCTRWHGYRPYVVGLLSQLKRLDGEEIRPSERIAAAQQWETLHQQLREEVAAQGIDPDTAAEVEDDSLLDAEEIPETGYVDEEGQLRRPWCRETRILEHREQERELLAVEERRRAEQQRLFEDGGGLGAGPALPKPRTAFPPLVDGEPVYQKHEGKWEFNLGDSPDGRSVVLDVDVGRYLDTSLVQADVQPRVVRLLIKGRLLQLALPQEVRPDSSTAQRSKTTGRLVITMPKENPADSSAYDITCTRGVPQVAPAAGSGGSPGKVGVALPGLAPQPLRASNGLAGQLRGISGGSTKQASAATVWEHDAEGRLVERQLQRATLQEAAAPPALAAGSGDGSGVDDELPPL